MAEEGSDCPGHSPPLQKRKLSLSLKDRRKKKEGDKRFANESPKVDRLKQKSVPRNMEKNMEWALKGWTDWRKNEEDKEAPPEDILKSEDGEAVCHWLCKFFTKVRKGDGLEYCPRSLSCILGGLHRYIESHSAF